MLTQLKRDKISNHTIFNHVVCNASKKTMFIQVVFLDTAVFNQSNELLFFSVFLIKWTVHFKNKSESARIESNLKPNTFILSQVAQY